MRWIMSFGRFWWDFIVGDDWVSALGVAFALGVTACVSAAGIDPWWLLPVAVVSILYVTLQRSIRR